MTDTAIEILDKIYFENDKAIIKPESFPILDAVAATLQGNPSIQLIEIQGHADERGDDAYNLDLSDRRAQSVKKYLVDKGVDAKRLTSQGYGETQPLDRAQQRGRVGEEPPRRVPHPQARDRLGWRCARRRWYGSRA